MRRWVVRTLPLQMVAGTIVVIVLETMSAPLFWHVWMAIVWIGELATSFRLWKGGRDQR